MKQPLLTPAEVCKQLKCSLSKLRGLPIPYMEVGGQRRYTESALQDYLVKNTVLPQENIKCQLPKGKNRRSTSMTSRLGEGDIEERWKRQAERKPSNYIPKSAQIYSLSTN